MPLRKSREQREARRAEIERKDREHSARLAAVNDLTRQGPVFCQSCQARLKSDAARCHYCGGTDLARSDPSAPSFSQAAPGGVCPKCGGHSFGVPGGGVGAGAAAGFLVGGVVGAAVGAAAASAASDEYVVCVTCGARFRRG